MDYNHLVEHMDDPVFQKYGDGIFCVRCLESTGSTKLLPRRLLVKGTFEIRTTSRTLSELCHGAPEYYDTVVEYRFNGQRLGELLTSYTLEEISREELADAWKKHRDLDFHFKRNGKLFRIHKTVKTTGSIWI